jgi:hypothetical protein
MSDFTLSLKIHQKHYSKIPFDEFARKIGFQSDPNADVDTTTGLRNLPARLKLSFIDNPDQRLRFLKSVEPSARRLSDGRLAFENPETGKVTTVDEEGRSIRDLADWVGMVPEIVGTGVGAAIAAPVPVPGARFAGGGVGYATGREVKRAIASKITGEPMPLKPAKEVAKEAGVDIAIGTGMELGGAAVLKTLAPAAKKITPATKRAMDYFKRYGGKFTPAQATETRVLDLLENVAESSIFGGGRMGAFKRGQVEVTEDIAQDIATRLGTRATPEEVGLLVQKSIEGKREAFNAAASALYKSVDNLTEGVLVSTEPLKKRAATLLKDIPTDPATGKALIPSLQDNTTTRMLQDFADLPDEVPFSYLQQWRSDLSQVGFAPTDMIPGKSAGLAKHLAKEIDSLFSKAEGGLTGDALEAFRAANTFWKTGKETFNNKFIKALVAKDPEGVVGSIFRKGAIQPIRRTMAMVDAEGRRKLKGSFVNKVIFKEAIAPDGSISGRKLSTILRNYGKETLREVLSRAERKELYRFANVLRMQQQKATGVGGGMLIQLTQAGAILELGGAFATGAGFTKMGGAILLGPSALSQVFTRPLGIRWLTDGLVTKPGSKAATRLAGRLITLAGAENVIRLDSPEVKPEYPVGP